MTLHQPDTFEELLHDEAADPALLQDYRELRDAVPGLPEYQPTRDLVQAALAEAEQSTTETGAQKRAWIAPALAALLILGGIIATQQLGSQRDQTAAIEQVAVAPINARPTFYFSEQENRTAHRIRATRERIQQRSSYLAAPNRGSSQWNFSHRNNS